jgi:two-component system response regulator HydG
MHKAPLSASALWLAAPGAPRAAVERAASAAGLELVAVATVAELLHALNQSAWSATIVSLAVDQIDGDVARRISEQGSAGALILTAPAISLERAMLTERVGAVALLREPLDEVQLQDRLAAATDESAVVPFPSVTEAPEVDAPPLLVGESPVMGSVFETVARVARSRTTVLLTGESGTGKEVVARALHWASDRKEGPFVAVNCAAIPEHLLESELFGHERGAFTGAVARRIGRFERANGGTLFLDEIGDMSLVLQAKVLRVLEDRVVERVGGQRSEPIDVRIVAATNQALGPATAEGRFREDLFYRLAVVELRLPPLRDRGDDIRRLTLHLGALFADRHGKRVRGISQSALRRLEQAPWPGNVRELGNVMDRAVLLAQADVVRTADLRMGSAAPSLSAHADAVAPRGYAPQLSLSEVESDHIRRVLESVDGHIAQAAESLGIHRNTLTRKMKEYQIDARLSAGTPQ